MALLGRQIDVGEISIRSYSCILDFIILDTQRYLRKIQEYFLQISVRRIKGPLCFSMGKMGSVVSTKNAWRMGIKEHFLFIKRTNFQVKLEIDQHKKLLD